MIKKSLIAIAVLAMALPAFAGQIKVHTPWPVAYVPQEITTIDVTLDVGFFIHIKDQKPIKVHQDTSAGTSAFETYKGCKTTDVITNFDALIYGEVKATSPAGGNWSATFDGEDETQVSSPSENIEICVMGAEVKIEKLQGGTKDVKVADLTILVLPAS